MINIYNSSKSKYMHLGNGALTMWRHNMNKGLHNRIHCWGLTAKAHTALVHNPNENANVNNE